MKLIAVPPLAGQFILQNTDMLSVKNCNIAFLY